jgi:aspartyl-tRNA(Asn)/glutamyl-tRNA(Gln) amidotransferase subunit A
VFRVIRGKFVQISDFTITQVHQGLQKKEFSALELAKTYLEKIKEENKKISAFLTVTENFALSQAKKIDDLILEGREIPLLAGVPLAVKDNILVENIRCTAGSKILENYIAPYDATVIKKLRAEGCLILGKTNLDEFAMGSSTENSAFGPTKNPVALERVPGGSSGGSAAAVAGNLSVFALGSDTGGSIRQPASFCGVVGLKPTYGAVSRYGLIAFASSLDQIGPITKNVEDAKIVFDVISGKDEMDSTSVNPKSKIQNPKEIKNLKFEIKNLKLGVPKEYFVKGIEPEVEKVIKEAIKKFEGGRVKIEEISLPHTEYALPCYYIIVPAEASANLARYDGIKYGFSKIQNTKYKIQNLLDGYLKTRGEGFGDEVRRRIMLGTYALSAGYYEAYYLRAQKIRTKIKEDFEKAFKIVDFILTPTSPSPAFKLGERIADPLMMYLSDIFTIAVNLAGLPAISIPAGKVKDGSTRTSTELSRTSSPQDLPVGLQIIGKTFEEEKIFKIGQFFEQIR